MKRHLVGGILMACAVGAVFADSIDDAEAKRRGVPLGQVQAENALAKERAKSATLEKQVAELQKQMAKLQGSAGSASTGASGATTTPTTTRSGGASTAPGAPYTFKLNRVAEKGFYDTHLTVERTYHTTLSEPGRPAVVKDFSLKADLTGRVWLNRVENGRIIDVMIEVKKFVINGNEMYKADTPLYLQPEGGRVFVLPLVGEGCPPDELLKAVEIMFDGVGENPGKEDEIYGTKGEHKVGVDWVVNPAALTPEVERLVSIKVDPAKLIATSRITAVEPGKQGDALRVNVNFDVKQFTSDPPAPGYTMVSSVMHGTYGRVVPVSGGPLLETSFEYDMTCDETSAKTRYQSKVHQSRTEVMSGFTARGK